MTTPATILGRRYEFVDRSAPDFTIISYNTATDGCYVHFRDGAYGVKQHLRLSVVLRALRAGALVESLSAPFVLARHEGIRSRV